MPGSDDKALSEDLGSDVPDNQDGVPDLGGDIDMPTFSQILEMDEGDPDRTFSKGLLMDFLTQAEETFEKIQESLEAKDLKSLSEQGHYLKGSSATLGLVKVRDNCEKVQRYGKKENVDGSPEPDEELCLKRIKETLKVLRADYKDVSKVLKRFFKVDEDEDDEDEDEDEEEDEEDEGGANAGGTSKGETKPATESAKESGKT